MLPNNGARTSISQGRERPVLDIEHHLLRLPRKSRTNSLAGRAGTWASFTTSLAPSGSVQLTGLPRAMLNGRRPPLSTAHVSCPTAWRNDAPHARGRAVMAARSWLARILTMAETKCPPLMKRYSSAKEASGLDGGLGWDSTAKSGRLAIVWGAHRDWSRRVQCQPRSFSTGYLSDDILTRAQLKPYIVKPRTRPMCIVGSHHTDVARVPSGVGCDSRITWATPAHFCRDDQQGPSTLRR